MSLPGRQKLQKLLEIVPVGTVALSQWLREKGFSPQLQLRYRNSGWLSPLGNGAMVRAGDEVGWEGALYALQKHAGLPIHVGGKSALSIHGKAHFLELSRAVLVLFGPLDARLPKWFINWDWGAEIEYHRTSFLPFDLGTVEVQYGAFSIKASAPVRALMECIHLASSKEEFIEAREMMDGLNNLRPKQVQALLESCGSVKVKRLFLYLADISGHDWLKYIDQSAIDLGSGTRSLAGAGVYVPKYNIMVPKELVSDAKSEL